MNFRGKLTLVIIIIFQFFLIIFLGQKIVNSKKILGKFVINPIKKASFKFFKANNLNNYYEPAPNTITEEHSWTPFYKGNYAINADGLRESRNYDISKKENVFRIVTLGDSFTYGLYIDTEDN